MKKLVLNKRKFPRKSFLILLVLTFLFGSCNDNVNSRRTDELPTSAPDIYVAGYEFTTDLQKTVAQYWKNGELFILSEENSLAIAIAASENNNVYVGGYIENTEHVRRAVYWKNGELIELTNGSESMIVSIELIGEHFFAAGYIITEESSPNALAVYWKDGEMISLTDGTRDSYATSITVSNNEVFVAGYESDGTPMYWRNGVVTLIEKGPYGSYVNDIAVHDNDIYIVGYEAANSNETVSVAKCWKNGDAVTLPNNLTGNCFAQSIAVSEGRFYIGGFTAIDLNKWVAQYWPDGNEPVAVSGPDDGIFTCESIAVSKGIVYTAGIQYFYNGNNTEGFYTPMYWIDDHRIELVNNNNRALALSIFIKE